MENIKYLINSPENCIEQMMAGVASVFPGLYVETEKRIAILNRDRKQLVGVISGGGSGHEPFPTGFVGESMLTASISGRLFSSPPSSNILSTIMNVARLNEGGVFVIILNYSGDVLNFGVAIEEAKTRGVKIASVIVGDDCSMTGSHANSSEIRRGLCGIILLIKIIGGMSTAGRPLKELDIEARAICCRMLTMGVCVAPCSMPGVGHPHFTMDDNTIGFGIGIHGEAVTYLTS